MQFILVPFGENTQKANIHRIYRTTTHQDFVLIKCMFSIIQFHMETQSFWWCVLENDGQQMVPLSSERGLFNERLTCGGGPLGSSSAHWPTKASTSPSATPTSPSVCPTRSCGTAKCGRSPTAPSGGLVSHFLNLVAKSFPLTCSLIISGCVHQDVCHLFKNEC